MLKIIDFAYLHGLTRISLPPNFTSLIVKHNIYIPRIGRFSTNETAERYVSRYKK